MLLFRAMSIAEYKDYRQSGQLHITDRSLEAKQFFRSAVAAIDFAEKAAIQGFSPRYARMLTFDLDPDCFPSAAMQEQILDGHQAVTIAEEDLRNLNNCITFVDEYVL